MDTIEIFGLL